MAFLGAFYINVIDRTSIGRWRQRLRKKGADRFVSSCLSIIHGRK